MVAARPITPTEEEEGIEEPQKPTPAKVKNRVVTKFV